MSDNESVPDELGDTGMGDEDPELVKMEFQATELLKLDHEGTLPETEMKGDLTTLLGEAIRWADRHGCLDAIPFLQVVLAASKKGTGEAIHEYIEGFFSSDEQWYTLISELHTALREMGQYRKDHLNDEKPEPPEQDDSEQFGQEDESASDERLMGVV